MNYDRAEDGGSIQGIDGGLDMMLNVKVQARQKPLDTADEFDRAVSCADFDRKLNGKGQCSRGRLS